MSKEVVITRKIQINFDVENKTELKDCFDKIFTWQRTCHLAANEIMSHLYMQDAVKDYHYFTEDVKVKLANVLKDEAGILLTSRDNATYQVLSKKYKGTCPMGMLSGLNTVICKKYKEDAFKIKKGEVSLATFRNNIPMPIRSADISNWKKITEGEAKGNYTFFVYGTAFKTFFGRDKSGNEAILDWAIVGSEYKLCDSSIQIEKRDGKNKLFLLAVFSFDKEKIVIDKEKVVHCRLGIQYPIVILEKKDKFWNIGTAEEYLHRRNAIKGALTRIQKGCKYNKGGKGREAKLQATERMELKEKNYIDSRMHLYSRQLIEYCIKRGIGKIFLDNYQDAVETTHEGTEESKYLLASWSYYNLSEKIRYKAAKYDIEVELGVLDGDGSIKKKEKKEKPVKQKIESES